MAKSVYSLVLSGEVVAAIDDLAARRGTSRSALINHVLAEYAQLPTPEQRAREILSGAGELADGLGFCAALTPGGTLTLRTALRYKYNPTLAYVVELAAEGLHLAQLRVGMRTQNEALLAATGQFFSLWQQLEARHLPAPPAEAPQAGAARHFVRQLRRPAGLATNQQAAAGIAAYVALLDNCLKTFLAAADDPVAAANAAEARYAGGLLAEDWLPDL